MKIAVLPNMALCDMERLLCDVTAHLRRYGAEVLLPEGTDFLSETADACIRESDAVVALGGDGTILRVAKHGARYGKPVLGINCGHLGFVAGLEADELDELRRLIAGEYAVEPRMMLEIRLQNADGSECVFEALNELAVTRGGIGHTAKLQVDCDGRTVARYRADGVVVATPTGSTAYSLSAGGPVVDPAVCCIVLTPLCPHSLDARSYVFGETSELSITIPAEENRALFLSADGEEMLPLCNTQKIQIRRSSRTADLIRIKPLSFYEVLRQKMIDRASV